MSRSLAVDKLLSLLTWLAFVAVLGSAIFGIAYGLLSLDDNSWQQIDKNCYVHEVDHNHAFGKDVVELTVYCKR